MHLSLWEHTSSNVALTDNHVVEIESGRPVEGSSGSSQSENSWVYQWRGKLAPNELHCLTIRWWVLLADHFSHIDLHQLCLKHLEHGNKGLYIWPKHSMVIGPTPLAKIFYWMMSRSLKSDVLTQSVKDVTKSGRCLYTHSTFQLAQLSWGWRQGGGLLWGENIGSVLSAVRERWRMWNILFWGVDSWSEKEIML